MLLSARSFYRKKIMAAEDVCEPLKILALKRYSKKVIFKVPVSYKTINMVWFPLLKLF